MYTLKTDESSLTVDTVLTNYVLVLDTVSQEYSVSACTVGALRVRKIFSIIEVQ